MIKRIKTITLTNFQSHKQNVLDVDSDIVILSGESNNGKSAILRGVLWLLTNRPSGIGFVSNWAKEKNSKGEIVLKKDAVCSVSIVFITQDGAEHTITRLRSRDKNVYIVDGVELEAVGTAVPDEVTKLTSMHECNIQSQDDSYFMLTLSAGQVASKLNELVHLDTIDKAYEYTRKCKLTAGAMYKEWTALASDYKLKLDGLKHIPELSDMLVDCESMVSTIEEQQDLLNDAKDLLNTVNSIKYALEHTVSYNCDMLERVSDLIDDYKQLTSILNEATDLYAEYSALVCNLSAIPVIDTNALEDNISELNTLQERLIDAVQLHDRYLRTVQDINDCVNKLAYLEKELPQTCPLCGSQLNKEEL